MVEDCVESTNSTVVDNYNGELIKDETCIDAEIGEVSSSVHHPKESTAPPSQQTEAQNIEKCEEKSKKRKRKQANPKRNAAAADTLLSSDIQPSNTQHSKSSNRRRNNQSPTLCEKEDCLCPTLPEECTKSCKKPKKLSNNQQRMLFYIDSVAPAIDAKQKRFEKESTFDLTTLDEHIQNDKIVVPFVLQLFHFINKPSIVFDAIGQFGGPPCVKTEAAVKQLALIEKNLKHLPSLGAREKLLKLMKHFGSTSWFNLPQQDKKKIENAAKKSIPPGKVRVILQDVELANIPDKMQEGKFVNMLLAKYRYEPVFKEDDDDNNSIHEEAPKSKPPRKKKNVAISSPAEKEKEEEDVIMDAIELAEVFGDDNQNPNSVD